ncbi:hypothetical protein K5E_21290 [Enterococcus thailandicus]|uniref:hypothetical protein n=1 Tax=Enterococcus thailandicus TaxID=417368 RepID=UPI00244D7D85|nr:hypothetical protein [Enterococcus thailandicus]GMC02826.1 hypothetical protein K4E_03390 [Enterococcus thailandicus]GMC09990.1 hypothetical protein K5E_21290 [Enterococcus thailandicus]
MPIGNFYLHPLQDYFNTSVEVVLKYIDYATKITESQDLIVVNNIYLEVDSKGKSLSDFLYGENQTEMNNYLNEYFTKLGFGQGSNIKWLGNKNLDDVKNETDFNKFITDCEIPYATLSDEESYEIDLIFIEKTGSFKDYAKLAANCYENLAISERSFKNASRKYSWEEYSKELTRHLNALNQFSEKLKSLDENDNGKRILLLKSTYGIICSGLGGNEEGTDFEAEDPIEDGIKKKFIPHTKLFKLNSAERIYFRWPEDDDGKIAIGYIGNHMN